MFYSLDGTIFHKCRRKSGRRRNGCVCVCMLCLYVYMYFIMHSSPRVLILFWRCSAGASFLSLVSFPTEESSQFCLPSKAPAGASFVPFCFLSFFPLSLSLSLFLSPPMPAMLYILLYTHTSTCEQPVATATEKDPFYSSIVPIHTIHTHAQTHWTTPKCGPKMNE